MSRKPKSQKRLLRFIFKFKMFRLASGIVIFSEARGGSTWLMELLGKLPRTIINWEPMHPDFGLMRAPRSGAHIRLSPEVNDTWLQEEFTTIFTMKKYNLWTLKFADRALFKRIVITKFIRCTALLPWILARFNFDRKPIYLLRHPVAACRSQHQAFDDNNDIKPPKWKSTKVEADHKLFYEQLESKLEQRVFIWCLYNSDVLKNDAVKKKCIWVFYEDLLLNPYGEMTRILNELGYKYTERLIRRMKFRKRSRTDFKRDFIIDANAQFDKAFDGVTAETKILIQRIFDYFEIKCYSMSSPYPDKPHLAPFIQSN